MATAFKDRTRDELYAEARRRDVKGRSKMNKAELVQALSGSSASGNGRAETNGRTPEPKRLDSEDARVLIAGNKADVFDVADHESEMEPHIPGARFASPDEIEDEVAELPEDREVIVVDEDGERSAEVAARLLAKGRKAAIIDGGMDKWRGAVQPAKDFEYSGPGARQPGQ